MGSTVTCRVRRRGGDRVKAVTRFGRLTWPSSRSPHFTVPVSGEMRSAGIAPGERGPRGPHGEDTVRGDREVEAPVTTDSPRSALPAVHVTGGRAPPRRRSDSGSTSHAWHHRRRFASGDGVGSQEATPARCGGDESVETPGASEARRRVEIDRGRDRGRSDARRRTPRSGGPMRCHGGHALPRRRRRLRHARHEGVTRSDGDIRRSTERGPGFRGDRRSPDG
jgi:hypothetical protein